MPIGGNSAQVGELYVDVRARMDKYQKDLDKLNNESRRAAQTASKELSKVNKGLNLSMGAIAGYGAVVWGALRSVQALTRGYLEFDRAMRNVNSIMGVSETSLAGMSDQLRDISTTLGSDVTDLANGLYQVASAGIDSADAVEFLDVAARAAKAGLSSTETAVDGLTTVINSYGYEAGEATRVSDIMFTTIKLGKTTFDQLASSLANVLPIASASGVSFEEVSAAIVELTKQGTPTAVATTQIRAAIVSLNEVLGDNWTKTMTLGEAMQKVWEMSGKSSTELKNLVGRIEGVNAITAIASKNLNGFNSTLGQMKNSGGEAAKALNEQMKSAAATIDKANAYLAKFVDKLGKLAATAFVDVITGFKIAVGQARGLYKTITSTKTQTEATGIAASELVSRLKALGSPKEIIDRAQLEVLRDLRAQFTAIIQSLQTSENSLNSKLKVLQAIETRQAAINSLNALNLALTEKMVGKTAYEQEALQRKIDGNKQVVDALNTEIATLEKANGILNEMTAIRAEIKGVTKETEQVQKAQNTGIAQEYDTTIKILEARQKRLDIMAEQAKMGIDINKAREQEYGTYLFKTELEGENNPYKNLQEETDKAAADIVRGQRFVFGTIENAFSDMITGMIMRGESFGDVMKNVWRSMATAFIGQITAMTAKWLAFQALTAVGVSFGGIGAFLNPFGGQHGGRFSVGDNGVKKMQTGGAFIVPGGYENDKFPLMVESGERVEVTPRARTGNQEALLSGIMARIEALNQNLVTGRAAREPSRLAVDVRGEIAGTAIKLASDEGAKQLERYR